jgi:hypothetical protein
VKYKLDIKVMLPIVVLTWLRQLQQFFFEQDPKKTMRTWSKLGNYTSKTNVTEGELQNPLGIVYLKSSDGTKNKVNKYADIKPLEEVYKKKKGVVVVCTSLEEWAMGILNPPVQKQLDQAILANQETKSRWNNNQKKLQKKYIFQFNDKNYATAKVGKVEKAPTLPQINLTNKTTEEIHLVINQSLQQAQDVVSRLSKKKKPTTDNKIVIEASRNATQAY